MRHLLVYLRPFRGLIALVLDFALRTDVGRIVLANLDG